MKVQERTVDVGECLITTDGRVVKAVVLREFVCQSCVFQVLGGKGKGVCTRTKHIPGIWCGESVFHEVKDEQ